MLKLNNVSKYFKIKKKIWKKIWFFPIYKQEQFEALKNISFEVKQWEKVAFIWPNWAWKSTTIKCILWILHYDEWEIRVFGKDPRKEREEIAKQVASVFGQRSQLMYHLPLKDSFQFLKIIYEIDDKKFEKRLDYLVEKFDLKDLLNQPVRKLSLWQRMKWEITASLLHSPKAIFLDEPTVWLDIVAKKTLYEVLLKIHKEENITIFLTSHDIQDIQALCDRTIIINKWELLFDGDIKKLFKRYANKKIIKYRYEKDIAYRVKEVKSEAEILEREIKYILEKWKLEDMNIEDIPLEEIIEKFY
jgi:ABC-2 type transport system ATP-binding protein